MSISQMFAPPGARSHHCRSRRAMPVLVVLLWMSAAGPAAEAQDRQMAPALGSSQGSGEASSAPIPGPPASPTLTADILLGRWCGDTTNYIFSFKDLTVEFHSGGSRVLKVDQIKTGDTWIDVHWVGKRPDGSSNNTVFSDFTPDRSVMFQAANVGGDNGPRRRFRRC